MAELRKCAICGEHKADKLVTRDENTNASWGWATIEEFEAEERNADDSPSRNRFSR